MALGSAGQYGTDWVSLIERDVAALERTQARRAKGRYATFAMMAALVAAAVAHVTNQGLTREDLWTIAPWWVSIQMFSLATSTLYSMYMHVHIPGLREKIVAKEKWPMTTPESLLKSATYLLMGLISESMFLSDYRESSSLVFGIVAILSYFWAYSFILNVRVVPIIRRLSNKYPVIKKSVEEATTQPQKFTSSLAGLATGPSIIGIIILLIVWDEDLWMIALQVSVLFSAFLFALGRNFNEYGRIVAADRVKINLLELRRKILTNPQLTEADIRTKYHNIYRDPRD